MEHVLWKVSPSGFFLLRVIKCILNNMSYELERCGAHSQISVLHQPSDNILWLSIRDSDHRCWANWSPLHLGQVLHQQPILTFLVHSLLKKDAHKEQHARDSASVEVAKHSVYRANGSPKKKAVTEILSVLGLLKTSREDQSTSWGEGNLFNIFILCHRKLSASILVYCTSSWVRGQGHSWEICATTLRTWLIENIYCDRMTPFICQNQCALLHTEGQFWLMEKHNPRLCRLSHSSMFLTEGLD